jgi:calcium/proton exchanger cax
VIELLIAILALVKGDIDIVQASMIGSILSNILLVLGMSYFAGGLRFHEQLYALAGAQMHISLLGLSVRPLFTSGVCADDRSRRSFYPPPFTTPTR